MKFCVVCGVRWKCNTHLNLLHHVEDAMSTSDSKSGSEKVGDTARKAMSKSGK